MLANKLLGAAKVAGAANYVEDVFSTWLYTGDGSGFSVNNGIDLSTKGGLVWLKDRSAANIHSLYDTVRGATYYVRSNDVNGQNQNSNTLTSFNTNGFTIGDAAIVNTSNDSFVSWTFREQPKFFDVVTYTGNGSNRTISHNLGSVPGFIAIKRTDSAIDWYCYHRSLTANNVIYLNLNNPTATAADVWNNTDPTSTVFSLGTNTGVNANGGTYVAYLFAHNAGGFGASGSDNVITCGSYTGNGSTTGPSINLGYEPQWIIVKNSATAGFNWNIIDVMRGMPVGSGDLALQANTSGVESGALDWIAPTATGFDITSSNSQINASGSTMIYIAIRRGPMKTPTSGTSVFKPILRTGTGSSASVTGIGFPPDLLMGTTRNFNYSYFVNKLVGANRFMQGTNTSGETSTSSGQDFTSFDQDGFSVGTPFHTAWNNSSTDSVMWNFRRASGFFDVVCDTGTASGHTITHGLGVVPELMIRKKRNSATNSDWVVWHTLFSGTNKYLYLNDNAAEATNSAFWTTTAPTSTVFSVGTGSRVNNTGDTYVTYLFATVAGVSKVGSYTGTGTTLTIDCGFTAGARFVLIKRTSSTGDWYVWDTARGIISGNDPYLLLNSTAAEVTNTDYIDPVNSGFQISSTAPVQINQSGGTFIFLAIA